MPKLPWILGFLSTAAVGVQVPGLPDVVYKGGILTARPAPNHAAQKPGVEVLESEECAASQAGPTSLKVTGDCAFLKGMFSYRHEPPGGHGPFQTFVGFTFSRKAGGHVLMVSGPFVVDALK